jgi:hypothetical protein
MKKKRPLMPLSNKHLHLLKKTLAYMTDWPMPLIHGKVAQVLYKVTSHVP